MRLAGAHWPVARRPTVDAEPRLLRAAERPGAALGGLLAFNLAVASALALIGLLVIGDQAELFRELAPGTFLSFLQLLLIATAARMLHRSTGEALWGILAVAFCIFAFDEITQAGIFIGKFLTNDLGLQPAAGFHDMEAVLLTLLFTGVGLFVLPRVRPLLRHPRALLLFAVAVALGAASQGLDSFAPPTAWEFVAEETLKLSAEVFFLGALLAVLADLAPQRDPDPTGQ